MEKSNEDISESSEDQEMLDLADELSFQQEQENQSMQSITTKRRGRKPLPPKWSRIIEVDANVPRQCNGYEIAEDIDAMSNSMAPAPNRGKQPWKPLFHPKTWWRENEKHSLISNIIERRALKAHAKKAVETR